MYLLPFNQSLPRGEAPEGMDVLWRCEARRYSVVIDAEREHYGSTGPKLELTWFKVERRTPKGAWIAGGAKAGETRRYIPLYARSRFAANSKLEAVADFSARRSRQRYILERQLKACADEQDLAVAALEQMRLNNEQ